MRVILPGQSEASLFEGCTQEQLDTLDKDASLAEYHRVWVQRVRQIWEEAEVTVNPEYNSPSVSGLAFSSGEDEELLCQSLGEDLFLDGNAWMVELEVREEGWLRDATPS